MNAYFKVGSKAVRCRVTSVHHDGDPKQGFPIGLFLADVTVLDDTYPECKHITLGAKSIFRLKDGACLHDLAKRKEVIVRVRGENQ